MKKLAVILMIAMLTTSCGFLKNNPLLSSESQTSSVSSQEIVEEKPLTPPTSSASSSSVPSSSQVENDEEKAVTEVVCCAFDSFKAFDLEKIQELFLLDSDFDGFSKETYQQLAKFMADTKVMELMKKFTKDFEYEVTDYKFVEEGCHKVTVEIENRDYSSLVGGLLPKLFLLGLNSSSKDEIFSKAVAIIGDEVSEKNWEITKTTLVVEVNKVENEYKIVPTDELINTVTGGVYLQVEELLKAMGVN